MNRTLLILCLPAILVGCKKKDVPPSAMGTPGQSAAGGSQGEADPMKATLTGKVIERIDAPPYSYLHLDTPQGQVWAAVPITDAAKGAQVSVQDAFPMNKFESKTLHRTFEVVYFGKLQGQGAVEAQGAPSPHAGVPPTPSVDVKVEKAQGPDARTIGEIYAQKASLKDKTVSVRGKVVKFNAQIMGKNWIHLQDGSGEAAKNSNDLTLTTKDSVAIGDVITAKGTLHLDKDFGSGYTYAVIVEDAKVTK